MIKEIQDQVKVLKLGDERAAGTAAYYFSGRFAPTTIDYHPNTVMCASSMEPGGFLPYPETPPTPPILMEWRCEACGCVMLQEHRKCEECGLPRHFLYRVGDDE